MDVSWWNQSSCCFGFVCFSVPCLLLKQDYSKFTWVYIDIHPCLFAGTFVSVEKNIAIFPPILIKILRCCKYWMCLLLSFGKCNSSFFKLCISVHVLIFIERGWWILLNAFWAWCNWKLLPLFCGIINYID